MIAMLSDVRAQRGHAAVGEDERLDDQHGRHDDDRRPRAEQDRRRGAAGEVPGRAAGDGEVEHLQREDERGEHGHEHEPALGQRAVRTSRTA